MLIDPPVGPYSPAEALEAWLDELRDLRARYADDEAAVEAIAWAQAEARQWLERTREGPPGAPGPDAASSG